MRINVAVPEAHVDAPVLDAALESVTRLNESMLAEGSIPTAKQLIEQGAQWQPEPPGDEHFDHGATIAARGHGDCDDWAPLHAASLRHTGEDPGARAVVRKSGPKRWHAIVERSNGTTDDPSRWAGMGTNGHGVSGIGDHDVVGVLGAVQPLMWVPPSTEVGTYIVRPQIAMRPVRGGIQSRVDIPWLWREHLSDEPSASDYAMTALHTAPVASTALTGCIDGAVRFASVVGFSCDEHLNRLAAISDAVAGAELDELADEYGSEDAEAAYQIVGSLFGGLAKLVRPITRPIARAAAPIMRPVMHAYDTVAPYTNVMFPGASRLIETARAAQSGNPMDVYKSNLMPGVQSGRAVFERNPLGHLAYSAAAPLMQNIPGAGQWLQAAAPRNMPAGGGMPQQAQQAFQQYQGGGYAPPQAPPMYQGGDGGGLPFAAFF